MVKEVTEGLTIRIAKDINLTLLAEFDRLSIEVQRNKRTIIEPFKGKNLLIDDLHRGLVEGQIFDSFKDNYSFYNVRGDKILLHYHDILRVYEITRD